MIAVDQRLGAPPAGAEGALRLLTTVAFMAAFALPAAAAVVALNAEQRAVALPTAVAVVAVTAMFCGLWRRDGCIPLFDIGVVCAGTALIYAALPPVFFLLAGLEWTDLSDGRLDWLNPSAEEFGAILWLPVAFLVTFALVYPPARGRRAPGPDMPVDLPRDQAWIVVLIALGTIGYQALIEYFYGVDLDPSYRDLNPGVGFGYDQLPLLLQQITHNVVAIGQVAKLALVFYLISQWRLPSARILLVGWLAAEVYMTGAHQGARSATAVLLLGALLSYHRLVKSFAFLGLSVAALVFLAVLIAYGYVRSHASAGAISATDFFSAANEFQVLAGNAVHLNWLEGRGLLDPIPWQVYFAELTMLVPQQLLPFEKMDPALWYLDVSGIGTDVGLMFGTPAQGVIGWGKAEMVSRGAALALVLAFVHRRCGLAGGRFWSTLCYLFLAVHIYYSYRATTFYWVYYFFYRFLPFYLAVRVLALVSRRVTSTTPPNLNRNPAQ